MVKKNSIGDLAIFGGKPAFDSPHHVGRPNIGDNDAFKKKVDDILNRKWLTNGGHYVKEFEKRIEDMLSVRHCIAMCNATVALEIAIRALGMKGEVIIPSFTFVATAHALQWQEITPVFCDIDLLTHTIDPNKIEQMITPRTTGIIGVHVWGRACHIEALAQIAHDHNIKLLFDSAHAFGCSYNGKMIGQFGNAEVFSFHATKFINSLEGGAVVTNDDDLAKKIRLMKNFGFTYYDQTDYVGTNGKMNEISAAMGITNIDNIEHFIKVNEKNYETYCLGLANTKGVKIIEYNRNERNNFQYVVLQIDERITELSRDEIVEILHFENILARRYFYPGCHKLEPYRSYFPHAGLLLPVTESLTSSVLCLPTGTGIVESEINSICTLLGFIIGNNSLIRDELNTRKNLKTELVL